MCLQKPASPSHNARPSPEVTCASLTIRVTQEAVLNASTPSMLVHTHDRKACNAEFPSLHAPSPLLCRYFTLIAATAMLTVGLSAKPDTDPQKIARREAIRQLREEGKL